MEITQVANTATFDHQQQQQVAKNKRKKFNPKFMLTNSSSDDEADGSSSMEKDDDDLYQNEIKNSIESNQGDEKIAKNHEIINDMTKSVQNNNNDSPPPSSELSFNPFLSPSKFNILQKFGNLQQQQQLLQQAALSQFSQNMNLSETEAKFREFAFKTMQELLNIYGLSLSTSDIADVLKQQQQQPLGK